MSALTKIENRWPHDITFKGNESKSSVMASTEIDLNNVAIKTFSSLALILINTCLSATVLLSKITGVTVVFPLALGHLTKSLHKCNMKLAKNAFTPFQLWAETLSRENHSIIETTKVIKMAEGKVMFNPKNYLKQSRFLRKAIFAPISLGSSIAAVSLCIVAKPLWLVLYIPGIIADGIALRYTYINNEISKLTCKPLQYLASKILKAQQKSCKEAFEGLDMDLRIKRPLLLK